MISKKKFDAREAEEAINIATKEFLGILGLSKAGIIVLKERFNKEKQKGILKVNNKYTDELKASFTLIMDIKKTKVTIRSVGTSGIIDKAQKNFID